MTEIEWTDATWNPVTGCEKVSPGCKNCYAETYAKRFFATKYPPVEYETYSVDACCPITEMRDRRFTDVQCHASRLDQPLKWRDPKRIFVNSMSDLFHPSVPEEFIDAVMAVCALCPRHTFQILTKRPDRMLEYFECEHRMALIEGAAQRLHFERTGEDPSEWLAVPELPNVWLGVSVEDQQRAEERIPVLLRTPAAVRFVSYEPALGPVDFEHIGNALFDRSAAMKRCIHGPAAMNAEQADASTAKPELDWVIVGGESGHGARPCDLAWIRSVVRQCKAADVPVFVKQMGSRLVNSEHPDDRLSTVCITGKGGDMSEWPEDVRVREFPRGNRD